jgi:DNA-binding beta-propeller fold protein YncE
MGPVKTQSGGALPAPPTKKAKPLGSIFALGTGLLAACTASAADVRPPADQIFFPTGAALAPDESVLFVANANSELRYDSGAISVFDLGNIDAVVGEWLGPNRVEPAGCSQDADHSETLVCEEAGFISNLAGVRIGNFATDIAVQDLGTGLRLVVPTRGDPSIAWIDWNGDRLSCNSSSETGFSLCDDAHRLSFVNNSPDLAVPDEPFGVFADTAGQFAMVTHLTSGAVTLIDSPKDGFATIADVSVGVFLPDPNTGLRGATGVVGRSPRANGDIVYVGSRSEDRIQTFTVGHPLNGAEPYLLQGNHFFLDAVGGNTGGSFDTRGMAFSPTGDRLYLVNRRPPSLQIFDTSLGPTGFPQNAPVGATDICRQASTVAVADSGDGERAYVTCFQDGQLYVIDPRGTGRVEDVVLVGRGPYSVVAASGRKKLYVTNFLEDTIAVVDLDPGSPTRNRVVLRVGTPRVTQ